MKVSKKCRILCAAVVWGAVGLHLIHLACTWMASVGMLITFLSVVLSICVAYVIHRMAFHVIADKNIRRIASGPDKASLFLFIPFKSYVMILAMILLGVVLRRSGIPAEYRAGLYMVMGMVLVCSSMRYIRVVVCIKGDSIQNMQ